MAGMAATRVRAAASALRRSCQPVMMMAAQANSRQHQDQAGGQRGEAYHVQDDMDDAVRDPDDPGRDQRGQHDERNRGDASALAAVVAA